MGKRKTKKVEVKKSKLPKLDKEFNCPFCNNTKTVGVKMNHKDGVGYLSCRVCGVEFTTRIGKLDEAVDVFSIWIDKCYEVNNATVVDNFDTISNNVTENIEPDVTSKMMYSNKTKETSESSSVKVNKVGAENDIFASGEFENAEVVNSGKASKNSITFEEKSPKSGDALDEITNNTELNKDRTQFDISNIASSSIISRSFTMNEDDGLFSD